MGSEHEAKKPRDTASLVLVLIVAAIVVAGSSIVYVLYANSQGVSGGGPSAIANGDQVTLNYIGRFSDGRVFDTSLSSVAADDANYPKSLTFTHRSNDSYIPFSMTAGNYGSGGTIKGFALGVIGLHVGDYKIIEVSPEDGYTVRPELITTINVTETFPIIEFFSVTNFKQLFATDPVPMDQLQHFFWKWSVRVVNVTGDLVMIANQPTVGESVYPFGNPNLLESPSGWEVRVIGYDPAADDGIGQITIQHMVSSVDVYNVKGTDSGGATFVVSAFDTANQSFQIHRSDSQTGYNGEISGRTLFFEVTILKVTPALS